MEDEYVIQIVQSHPFSTIVVSSWVMVLIKIFENLALQRAWCLSMFVYTSKKTAGSNKLLNCGQGNSFFLQDWNI